ncbi:PREDICTED: potassium voltage-gated channel subfamily H member 5-like [Nicrophorus vespilloides]|uniref:Potassium voltage-gated channel subfamily H member 5-like n=1 Tax=Nicrophorus vespilloides TaxID=110193 RepID=A0ABM1MP50_NICVS|nr:PREDICTED: potassium voltage-gated channel subfamily H member 5-like [Nicrophorus vespilloides]
MTLKLSQFFIHSVAGTQHRILSLIMNFSLIFMVIIHTFATVWKYICVGCDGPIKIEITYNWINQRQMWILAEKRIFSTWDLYVVCVFYTIGALSSTGYGGPSSRNDTEQMVIIVIMLTGTFLIEGSFLGRMDQSNIPKGLEVDIKLYFMKYLRKRVGYIEPSVFSELPFGVKNQVYLDKYWFALNKSFLFVDAPDDLKREVASKMQTITYSAGETVFALGHNMNMMIFVARGSVEILSNEDTKTKILCLGMGTSIGSINLLYNRVATHEIRASTYCVIHVLRRIHLWQINVLRYHNNRYTAHILLKAKMKIAKIKMHREANIVPIELEDVKSRIPEEVDIWANMGDPYINQPYTMSKVAELSTTDKVFVRSTWPWLFQPHSDVIRYWDTFVCVTIIFVISLYPYYLTFIPRDEYPFALYMFQVFASLVYIMDVLIYISIPVVYEEELETSIKNIFIKRLRSWIFLLDLLAAIPIVTIKGIIDQITYIDWELMAVMQYNALVKFFKVRIMIPKLQFYFIICRYYYFSPTWKSCCTSIRK